jgi:hypothetical protein
MLNPLIPEILELLQQHPQGISEYEIFKHLGDHAGFSDIGDNGQLPLFQKHFLIMNGLYQLQQNLWDDERLVVDITPLKIFITRSSSASDNTHPAISGSANLRLYYLDWANLKETSEEDVIELHQLFWERFNYDAGRGEALIILGLDESASTEVINFRYRKLAAEHHPDRGGCSARFIEIRKAYELLRKFS